jgi:hypothetical protein
MVSSCYSKIILNRCDAPLVWSACLEQRIER